MSILLVVPSGVTVRCLAGIERIEKHEVIGLALWPDAESVLREMSLKTVTTDDLIGNQDHENVSDLVVDVARNWWQWLGFSDEELSIDGLKITEAYRYEVELSLSALLLNIKAVQKAVQQYAPRRIVFATNKLDEVDIHGVASRPFSMQAVIGNYPLGALFKNHYDRTSGPTVTMLYYEHRNALHCGASMLARVKSAFDQGGVINLCAVIRKKLFGKKNVRFEDNAIVVGGGGRCLRGFLNDMAGKYKIIYLPHTFIAFPGPSSVSLDVGESKGGGVGDSTDHLIIDGISFRAVVENIYRFTDAQYPYLLEHYNSIRKMVSQVSLKAYITITGGDALSRVTIWSFHKSGTRTIWHGDGLGQFSEKTLTVVESAWWTSSPTEKWLVSENLLAQFLNIGHRKDALRVTGYLDDKFCEHGHGLSRLRKYCLKRALGVGRNDKVVVYATSGGLPTCMRLVSEETIFETLRGVSEVAETFEGQPGFFTVIKMHPGMHAYRYLFEQSVSGKAKVKVVEDIPMNELMDIADIAVVYHSSVGLEALFRGKHLIIYNRTGRPSYLTEIYAGLNKDPSRGACARIARNKDDVWRNAMEFEEACSNCMESPGLGYYLENAKDGYDMEAVTESIMK